MSGGLPGGTRRSKNQEVSRTKRYIEALQGISYRDWIKLREGIDGAFAKEKGEFEKTLKFANPEDAERVIRSRFGCKLD